MNDTSNHPTIAPLRLNRRRVVQGAAASVAAGIPIGRLSASDRKYAWELWRQENPEATPETVEDYTPVALSDSEWQTLTAAVDRLFPKTETTPGGSETGAHIYIDRKLSTVYGSDLPSYQEGLAGIENAVDGGFTAADAEAQDSALRDIEAGKGSDVPEGFFALLLEHTRQGMFCDPIHGGNREFMGWDMIGYPGIKLVWTAEDQSINTEVEPEYISVEQYGGTAR